MIPKEFDSHLHIAGIIDKTTHWVQQQTDRLLRDDACVDRWDRQRTQRRGSADDQTESWRRTTDTDRRRWSTARPFHYTSGRKLIPPCNRRSKIPHRWCGRWPRWCSLHCHFGRLWRYRSSHCYKPVSRTVHSFQCSCFGPCRSLSSFQRYSRLGTDRSSRPKDRRSWFQYRTVPAPIRSHW